MEKILPYKCNCGGTLKISHTQVEFFGIDFGIRESEICTKCGSEYLSNEVLNEIEAEVKKKKLFGLEKQAQITKSGNSFSFSFFFNITTTYPILFINALPNNLSLLLKAALAG